MQTGDSDIPLIYTFTAGYNRMFLSLNAISFY